MNVSNVDVVVGLQYGDEAKGKITHHLISEGHYNFVCRASGGPNAGHTIYHRGKKAITHHIPSGVFYGVPSIIGAGCVINPVTLQEEIEDLEKHDINVRDNLHIAYNAHIITPEHVEEDRATDKVGSTKRGIMPVYRDKYARSGLRAEDVPALKDFLCDPVEVLEGEIIIEGAQGLGLCPDHGDYPYVTSSPPTTSYALHSMGLPPQKVRKVWGAAKIYETYVGTKKFQPEGQLFNQLVECGEEYGSTTGRARQTNWIDLQFLLRSMHINGISDVVFSKTDVLEEVGVYEVLNPDKKFSSMQEMQSYLSGALLEVFPNLNIYWSSSKEGL